MAVFQSKKGGVFEQEILPFLASYLVRVVRPQVVELAEVGHQLLADHVDRIGPKFLDRDLDRRRPRLVWAVVCHLC